MKQESDVISLDDLVAEKANDDSDCHIIGSRKGTMFYLLLFYVGSVY